MSKLILPPTVLFNQERERMVERHGELRWFDRQLKLIDDRLELVKATESALAPDLVPGFWHVKRRNDPPAMDSHIAIKGPDGQFAEPSSGWLEAFRADDAWNNGGWDEMKKRWDRREAAREREKESAREQRVEELAGRIKALDSPGVSFSEGKPWTYRAGARRSS